MYKRIGFIIVLILTGTGVQAQPKLNYPEVDKISYELYLKGNWKELINYSREARQQEVDFFYLQVRTGIACYNTGKYRTAARWFLKAWETDPSPEWLQEYVYYSLIFGGRPAEAYKLAEKFSTALKEKIGYVRSKIVHAGLEAGYSFNPDYGALATELQGKQPVTGEEYGEAFFLKNYHFESFDLSHRIAPAITLNHNLTYVGLNRGQNVDWVTSYELSSNTSQFQYFLNPHLVLGRKWNVSPSLNLIKGEFSYALGGFRGNNRYFTHTSIAYTDVVASLSTWTHFGKFSPGAELNQASISDDSFRQASLWLTFYPFSNLNFYFTPRAYFKGKAAEGFGYNAFGLSGGLQLGQVHVYGQYLNGEMENFIEAGGYLVSNFPGTSEQKISVGLYFPVNKRYRFVLRYIIQDVNETYSVYSNLQKIRTFDYDYTKQTITAGISWSF